MMDVILYCICVYWAGSFADYLGVDAYVCLVSIVALGCLSNSNHKGHVKSLLCPSSPAGELPQIPGLPCLYREGFPPDPRPALPEVIHKRRDAFRRAKQRGRGPEVYTTYASSEAISEIWGGEGVGFTRENG